RRASTMASRPGGRAGQNQGKPARQYLLKKISARPRTSHRAPAIFDLPTSTVILFSNLCKGVVVADGPWNYGSVTVSFKRHAPRACLSNDPVESSRPLV